MSKRIVVGKKENGEISICSAKIENRGIGRCTHFEHTEIDSKNLKEYMFEQLSETQQILPTLSKSNKPRQNAILIAPSRAKKKKYKNPNIWMIEDLKEETEKIKNQVKVEHFDEQLINNFYKDFEQIAKIDDKDEATKNLSRHLKSNSEDMKKLREYLDNDVNLDDLSNILVNPPSSMVDSFKWRTSGSTSVSRVLLSKAFNNMDKKNYVKSVLYFKGKCCYCNVALDPNDELKKPTGEHLTPINPENPEDTPGATQAGNMALACSNCNSKRKSTELNTWMCLAEHIDRDKRPGILGKISSFRDFMNYNDFNQRETQEIKEAIKDLSDFVSDFKNPYSKKGYMEGSTEIIEEKINEVISNLQQAFK